MERTTKLLEIVEKLEKGEMTLRKLQWWRCFVCWIRMKNVPRRRKTFEEAPASP